MAIAVILFFFVLFFSALILTAGGVTVGTLAGVALIWILIGIPLALIGKMLEENADEH